MNETDASQHSSDQANLLDEENLDHGDNYGIDCILQKTPYRRGFHKDFKRMTNGLVMFVYDPVLHNIVFQRRFRMATNIGRINVLIRICAVFMHSFPPGREEVDPWMGDFRIVALG